MHILISGAGIAGPTLAYFLQRAGHRITVVEKAHALLPHGQNIDIEGSGIAVVKKMGLFEEILAKNTTEKGTQFVNPKGKSIAPLPVIKGLSVSPTSELEILRGDLAMILYKASVESPGVQYLFDTTVKEVLENNDDAVKVLLSNGQTQTFDLLVAADGQWSKIRKQCFPPVTTVDKNAYTGYWTSPRLPSDNDWWNIYFGLGSRTMHTRPDPYGTIRGALSHMPRDGPEKKAWETASRGDRKTQQELLRSEFSDAGWQAQRLLDSMDQAPDFYFQAVKQIRMSKWSNGRVICLGDAAFAPTPLSGMGTTLALTAAYVLGGELSELKDGEHPAEAFSAYEKTLRPFVEETQDIPSFVPAIMHPATALRRWLLFTLVSTISRVIALAVKIPWTRRFLVQDEKQGFTLPSYPRFDSEKS